MEIGLIFALLTTASFAISAISVRRGVYRAGESFTAVVISLFIGTLLFSIIMLFTADWDSVWSISWRGFALLGGAGIIHFVAGRFFMYTSVRLIGANKSSAIVRTSIFYAVILGIIVFDETLTTPAILGILLIAGGAILAGIEKRGFNAEEQSKSSKVQLKGILSGLGAGLCWGVSGVLIKLATEEISSPFTGTFIPYLAAFPIVAVLLFRKKRREQLLQLRRSALIPLIISAVAVAVAHIFRYTALRYSPVSLVTPLMSSEVLLILLFSFLLNRKIEVFTWKVILGMVATAVGAVLIFY